MLACVGPADDEPSNSADDDVIDDDSGAGSADDDDAVIEQYGCNWNADDLDNLVLGTEVGRQVSYRFRATHGGQAEGVRVYLVYHGPGYFGGDGGQVLLTLQPDDGSAAHLPSGEVMASSLVTDPMTDLKQWNRLFAFAAPADVAAGQLYHLVFSNPAPDPAANYVSVDGLHLAANQPDMQPGISDTDLATLYRRSEDGVYEVVYCVTPIFSLRFADGHRLGQCYIDVRDEFDYIHVFGDAAVRELFTVSGPDRVVSGVRVRLRRAAGDGALILRLTHNDTLLEEGTVPAAQIGASDQWIVLPFSTAHTLASGQQYALEVRASADTTYTVPPLQDGTAYDLDCDSLFADGHYQFFRDGEWGMTDSRTDFEMQVYFDVIERRVGVETVE